MRNKVQTGVVLERIVEGGDTAGLEILVGEMAHLPKARDFVTSIDIMAKVFRLNKALSEDESLMLHAHRLTSMSKRLFKDREKLKPLLDSARNAVAEWTEWAEADDPTEEEIQGYLERVAGTMEMLDAALKLYDAYVLTKLKDDRNVDAGFYDGTRTRKPS
jgi:hypothetical protein